MSDELKCWVVSDGRRGIENQALGLAEALSSEKPLNIVIHKVSRKGLRAKFPVIFQRWFGRKDKLPEDLPEIAIGCGRRAIPVLLKLRKRGVFTVYIQDPRIDPAAFDLVIAPEHDNLSGANVFSIIGSPNRVTAERLEMDKDLILAPSEKMAAFLIGGTSKAHRYTEEIFDQHIQLIDQLIKGGWQVCITVSRRTPAFATETFATYAEDHETVSFHAGVVENPFFAYLYHADMIFVTEDSTNMLTEACSTGKPVFRLPMEGYHGKFQTLYDALEKRCHLRPATTSDLTGKEYPPLQESKRAADFIWTQYAANR
ncbi:MAG: hypothetical protein HKN36_06835 [Hellea sp.]|nr:hypothetical protein [Hellea sp.]